MLRRKAEVASPRRDPGGCPACGSAIATHDCLPDWRLSATSIENPEGGDDILMPGFLLRQVSPLPHASLITLATEIASHIGMRSSGYAIGHWCRGFGIHPDVESAIAQVVALGLTDDHAWMLLSLHVWSRPAAQRADRDGNAKLHLAMRLASVPEERVTSAARIFRRRIGIYAMNHFRLSKTQRFRHAIREAWQRIRFGGS